MIQRWVFPHQHLCAFSPRTRLALLGLFMAALVILFPLRFVLAFVPGLSARDVQGVAWWGEVHDMRLGPVTLPHVNAGVSPWGGFWLRGSGIRGRMAGGSGWFRLSGVTGTVSLPEGVDGLPIRAATFNSFGFVIADGHCQQAQGAVRVTIATPAGALPLTGTPRCQSGALLVPLQGPGGMEAMVLHVSGSGKFTLEAGGSTWSAR